MSQTIDNKIVSLEFQDSGFEENVNKAIDSLQALKKSLNMDAAAENLLSLNKAAQKVDLSAAADSVDGFAERILGKISKIPTGIGAALGTLFGGLTKDLIIDPLGQAISGGIARSQKIADAKFQLQGLGITWNDISEDIDYAVDGTAFGLDSAAKAASQFATAGVKLGDEMKSALRAISGVAAMGSATYDEIAPIFTKAAGNNKVMADELNRIAIHGVSATAELAKFFNTIETNNKVTPEMKKKILDLTKGMQVSQADIREFASKSKISFDIFAEAMDEAFGEHAKDANNTFTGALDNMKAALSRIGQDFRAPIMDAAIGVFNSLRLMINAIRKNLSPIAEIWERITHFIGKVASAGIDRITGILQKTIEPMQDIGHSLLNILLTVALFVQRIGAAFKAVFGKEAKDSAGNIKSLAKSFEEFTRRLIPSEETLAKFQANLEKFLNFIKSIATALGPVIKTIASGLVYAFKPFIFTLGLVLSIVAKVTSVFIKLGQSSTSVGDFFNKIKNAIISIFPASTKLKDVFDIIENTLVKLASKVKEFQSIMVATLGGILLVVLSAVKSAFDKLKTINLKATINQIKKFISSVKNIPQISEAVNNIKSAFSSLVSFLSGTLDKMVAFFSGIRTESSKTSISVGKDWTTIQKVIFVVTNAIKGLGAILGGVALGGLTLFNKAFDFIKNFKFENVVNSIKDFISSVKEIGLLNTLTAKFKNVGGIIGQILNAILDHIRSFIQEIKDSGSIIDFLINKLIQLSEKLSMIKDNIMASLFGQEVSRGGQSSALTKLIQLLGEKFIWLKGKVGEALTYIREEGLLTKTLMVAYVLAILRALINFTTNSKKITEALTSEGGFIGGFKGIVQNLNGITGAINNVVNHVVNPLDSLSKAIDAWGEAQKKSAAENFAIIMKSFAISVVALAGSLALLYYTVDDIDKFRELAITMGIFMGAMAVVAGVMTVIASTKLVDQSFFNSFAANMISMAICIGAMGLIVNALSKLEGIKMLQGLAGLVVILALFLAVQTYLSRISTAGVTIVAQLKGVLKIAGKIALAAASLSLIAAGILLMAIALKQVQKLNLAGQNGEMDNLIMGIAAIGLIFMAVIYAAKFTAGAAKGILEIAGALALLGLAALQLVVVSLLMKAVDVESLVKMGGIMIVLAMIFGLLAKGLGGTEAVKGVVGLAIAIQMLTIAMLNLSLLALLMRKTQMSIEDFKLPFEVLGILSAILAVLVIVAGLAGKGTQSIKPLITVIVGLTLVFGELLILAVLCSEEKTFHDILKAVGILGGILLAFAAVIYATSKIKTGKSWAPIAAMLVGLGGIFAALIILSKQVQSTEDFIKLIAITAIMGVLAFALMKMLEHFLKFAKEINAGSGKFVNKALIAMGVMFLGFIALTAVLGIVAAKTDGYQVAAMAIAIGAAMIALAFVAKIIIEATKKIKWKELAKAAATMGVLIIVMMAIAKVLAFMSNTMDSGVTRGVGDSKSGAIAMVMLVMGELTLIALAMQKIGRISIAELGKASLVLLALTAIFVVLAVVLSLVGTLPIKENLLGKSQIIMLVLAELVAISAVLGFLGAQGITSLAALPTLAILTAIFLALGVVVTALGMFAGDAKELLKKTQVVMLVLAELVAIEALLGVMAALGATAMLALPTLAILVAIFLGVSAIAAILNQFGGDATEMLKKTQIVMLILVELVAIEAVLGAMAALGVLAIASLPALLGLVLIFGAVGLIAAKINELNLEGVDVKLDLLTSFLWKLIGIMAVMALLSAGAIGELAGAGALLIIAMALVPLTQALQNLQNVDLDAVANGLQLLSQALGMLVQAGVGAMVLGAGLLVMAVGIGAVGVSCMVAAPGITALAMSLMILAPAIAAIGLSVTLLAEQFTSAFQNVLTELSQFPSALMQTLVLGLENIVGAVKSIGAKIANSLVQGFRDAIGWHSPIDTFLAFFGQAKTDFVTEGAGLGDVVNQVFSKVGLEIPDGLTTGMKNGEGQVASGAFNLGGLAGSNYKSGAMPDLLDVQTMMNRLGFGVSNMKAELDVLDDKLNKHEISLTQYENEYTKITEKYKQNAEAADDVAEGIEGIGNAAGKASKQVKTFQETLTDTLTNQLNIFSKFEQKNPMNKDELLNNMKSQIKGMTDWSNNMTKLAQMGIDQGLYKKLAEMGPQGAEYVGAFVQMSAEELGMANELWAESLVLPGAVANQIGASMESIGENTLLGYQNGLDAQTNNTLKQLGVIAQDGVDTFAGVLQVQSPSVVFYTIGEFCMIGLYNGLNALAHLPIDAITRICNKMVDKAREILEPEKFKAMGIHVIEGLVQGMTDPEMLAQLENAVEALGILAEEAMAAKLMIESPSKVFANLGRFIPLGLAKGIDDNASVVSTSVEDMADVAVNQMKSTIAKISDAINNEIPDPVITPVLDLSKVQAGARLLNSTFSANAAIAAGASQLSALQNGQYPGGNVVFNQYNNSPKALSRIDIYRDTRNMLSQFKQAST